MSTSVSHFYDPASPWAQCEVVNAELGQTTCCQNGSSSACNQPWYLDKALTRTGNLASFSGGVDPMSSVESQVNGRRVVGARIGWSGGGGHFVILDGYNDASATLHVDDPFYGPSDISYDTFRTSYQGTGSWTHTYLTEP